VGRRPWNRNIQYHDVVLSALPPSCGRVLDVGCGDGLLASKLAERCGEVVAIDVDAPTLARAGTAHRQPNLSFVEADVMSHPFDKGSFDCVASIAALHHLPLAPALERFNQLLRPGGVLASVGLYRLSTPADLAWAFAAMPVSWWLLLTNNYKEVVAPIRDPDETLAEIEERVVRILPGALLERRLLFRYSLVWQKHSS
jgi:SAM-dependent methyltransferase